MSVEPTEKPVPDEDGEAPTTPPEPQGGQQDDDSEPLPAAEGE